MKILVLEPAWDGIVHLPANLGLLLMLRSAFPNAEIIFAGGSRQVAEMYASAPSQFMEGVCVHTIDPYVDTDTLISDVRRREQSLNDVFVRFGHAASFIFLCSATATVLAAVNRAGFSKKTFVYLHGNASEISGWRSRNPFRRYFDFAASIRAFCKAGGVVLVYEDRIRRSLLRQFDWMNGCVDVIGHPLLEDEAELSRACKPLGRPIKIGFPGLATPAKGFLEFLSLAKRLNDTLPGWYEFHGIGTLHPSCSGVDQSFLARRSESGLPREEYIRLLKSMHFLFAWHSDRYYSNAASGVVYDAINLGVPIIVRRSEMVDELVVKERCVGLIFDNIDQCFAGLSMKVFSDSDYAAMTLGMIRLREHFLVRNLAPCLARLISYRFDR